MRRPRRDPVIAAILAEIATVDRTLARLRVPVSAWDDLRQDAVWQTWREALRGRVQWHRPAMLRGFLRIVTTRAVFEWWAANPIADELREDHASPIPDPFRVAAGKAMLRFLRASTSPERWRALRAVAKGIPAHAVARREGVPTATIYTRIRLAREDIARALARDDAAIFVRRKK